MVKRNANKTKKVSSLIEEYLTYNQRLSWSSKQITERSFRYLIQAIGDMSVGQLSLEHAEIYQSWLLARYAKATANIYVKAARPVFRWAMRRKWIKEDIFAIPLCKISDVQMRIYEPWEFQTILQAAPNNLWRCRIWLGRSAGLRRSEVLNLTMADIDFDRKLIHVQPKKEGKYTWSWEPKGRKYRTLPLLSNVAELLIGLKNELLNGQPYLLLTEIRYWQIQKFKKKGILSPRVRSIPDENFSKPFRHIVERARISHGTFHDLRKTYLTEMAESGMPIHWLQELAGHADSKTTMKYYVAVRQKPMLERARNAVEEQLAVSE